MSADDDPRTADEPLAARPSSGEAEEFLRRFHRPPKPPSPEPERRPESAGGDFVAHYTVARPVAATKRETTDPGVRVHDDTSDLAALIRSDSSPTDPGARDASTALRTTVGRRRATLALAAVSLASLALFSLVAVLTPRAESVAPVPANSPVADAAAPGATLASAPGASLSSLASSPLRPEAPVPPSAVSAANTLRAVRRSSSPKAPDAPAKATPPRDPTTDMLPDEP